MYSIESHQYFLPGLCQINANLVLSGGVKFNSAPRDNFAAQPYELGWIHEPCVTFSCSLLFNYLALCIHLGVSLQFWNVRIEFKLNKMLSPLQCPNSTGIRSLLWHRTKCLPSRQLLEMRSLPDKTGDSPNSPL